jgi:hypothetical protein
MITFNDGRRFSVLSAETIRPNSKINRDRCGTINGGCSEIVTFQEVQIFGSEKGRDSEMK